MSFWLHPLWSSALHVHCLSPPRDRGSFTTTTSRSRSLHSPALSSSVDSSCLDFGLLCPTQSINDLYTMSRRVCVYIQHTMCSVAEYWRTPCVQVLVLRLAVEDYDWSGDHSWSLWRIEGAWCGYCPSRCSSLLWSCHRPDCLRLNQHWLASSRIVLLRWYSVFSLKPFLLYKNP